MTIRENAYSTNGWNLLSTFLCIESMALLISSPIVLAATWGIMRHTVFAYAGVFAVAMPICLLLAWSHNRYLQKRGGFVELEDDTLHYYENEDEPPVYSAPHVECFWFEGYRTWATLPLQRSRQDSKTVTAMTLQIEIGPQAILLQFPEWLRIPEYRMLAEQPVIVAVGQSQDTREQWAFALENTGITCDMTRHRRWLAPISEGLFICWFFFCGFVSFMTLPRVSWKIENLLNNWNLPADVASALSFSVFIPGVMFAVVWFCIFPFFWINTRTGIRKTKIPWYSYVLSVVMVYAIVLVPLWQDNARTFDWKMTYTISSVTMLFVTCVFWWLLVRIPKRKESDIMEQQPE